MPVSESSEKQTTDSQPESETGAGYSLNAALKIFPGAITLIAVLATCCSLFARQHWTFDLLAHFRMQYALAALVGLLVLIALRHWKLGIAMAIVLICQLVLLGPYRSSMLAFWPTGSIRSESRVSESSRQDGSAGKLELKVLAANVLSSNQNYDPTINWLREQEADFVALVEVSQGWATELRTLSDHYPHQELYPRDNNFGLALLSKFPLSGIRLHQIDRPGWNGTESLIAEAEVTAGDQSHRLVLIVAHPPPPMSGPMTQVRNQQLQALAQIVSREYPDAPTILCGDLNISPWSPWFKDFSGQTGLRDTRIGFGMLPTWPQNRLGYGLDRLLNIPIDFVLVSSEFDVSHAQTFATPGSDHRALNVDLLLNPR